MKKGKHTVFICFVLVAAVVITAAFMMWEMIGVFITPKTTLLKAGKVISQQLQDRFANSPIHLLSKAIDPEGKNAITMELETQNVLLGTVQYNMGVNTQLYPRRIHANGSATAKDTSLDLSLYMDRDFAAVSSDILVNGKYYGICYDSFPGDIQKIGLVGTLIGEKTIGEWKEKISSLQRIMNEDVQIPALPEVDIYQLAFGVLALKPNVKRIDMIVNEKTEKCAEISFQSTGKEIYSALEQAQMKFDLDLSDESVVTVSFYLFKSVLIGCGVTVSEGNTLYCFDIYFGENPATNCINVCSAAIVDGQTVSGIELSVDTVNSPDRYEEVISAVKTDNGIKGEQTIVAYNWNLSSGAGIVSIDRGGNVKSSSIVLSDRSEGFCVETDDFEGLLSMLFRTEDRANSYCKMVISKGTEFPVPSYVNLDSWSLQDFIILIGGFGSLLGIK